MTMSIILFGLSLAGFGTAKKVKSPETAFNFAAVSLYLFVCACALLFNVIFYG